MSMQIHRRVLVVAVFAFVLSSVSWAEDQKKDDFESIPLGSRLSYLKSQAPAALANDFLIQALQITDASNVEIGTIDEQDAKKQTMIWLCQTIGMRKIAEAAPLIRKLPGEYKDPFVRGESWLASARLADRSAIPEMIRSLRSLNAGAVRTRVEEVQAWFLVQSLGTYPAQEAFSDVFKAAIGWYSPTSQVKETARKVLKSLTSDYSGTLINLVKTDEDAVAREAGFDILQGLGDSEVGTKAAAAAVASALAGIPRSSVETDSLNSVRIKALRVLAKASSVPAESLENLKEICKGKYTQEEKQNAVRALGKISLDSAVIYLSDLLHNYNNQQKFQINTSDDIAMVKTLIEVMGGTKNVQARPSLVEVEFYDYTPAIVKEARVALDKIPN